MDNRPSSLSAESARGAYTVDGLVNPIDLPPEARASGFRLIAIHPTPLLRGARLDGDHLRLQSGASGVTIPAGMAFLLSYQPPDGS